MPKKSRDASRLGALRDTPQLGPLEAQVMEIVWRHEAVTVRDVHDVLRRRRDLAYTTVMTVMHNLYRKRLLSRRHEGQAHVYTPRQSQSEYVRSRVGGLLDQLLEDFSEPALAHFVDRVRQVDPNLLAHLERLIAEGRAQEESDSE